ncbi:hypothetical protein AB0K02_26590 [Streptomyces sp. NPDC049597]|uniref:hypothetical protein n=1 Tax=Streptomyces sp. NPDC049597 TaxID=3155276 RepID=UPI0034410379
MNEIEGNALGDQEVLLSALARFAQTHPALPGGYISTSSFTPTEAHVLLDTASALEAWREALHVDTTEVARSALNQRTRLEFVTRLGRSTVVIYAVFSLATEGAAV